MVSTIIFGLFFITKIFYLIIYNIFNFFLKDLPGVVPQDSVIDLTEEEEDIHPGRATQIDRSDERSR